MRTFFSLVSIAICCSCGNKTATPVIPAKYVRADEKSFLLHQGVLYLNGRPFSGNQYALYAAGDTAYIIPFYKGREYGKARQWYASRRLKEVRFFVNGQKTGEHNGWWENGQMQFTYHFSKDVFEGTVKEWYANGRLFRQMHYSKGTESGRQQIWQPDGSVFANYEARDGRNYGLTGTMQCKNYWFKAAVQ